ncbi:pyridoxal phosphate-dependent aminotransferase [Catalinimonas niigatensis]|uniref:pyridoxal phosphate-dependent aminotransferase n=1 Tax=Catalinimonas niigatensis TaxID=1397264 RepID=UPI0026670B76|nr:aminotransferase class I/II-fold pyridoxal phosphate-dependent enzyme [Catalinimonas niigatensis]WPP49357.1 aminotransferase class I/II-fold pyridoxal phosphate-dependent enzyme [Catalinimonas niigatensis]
MIIPTANRLQNVKEYYFSVKLQEIRRMREEGLDVINMGIGSPDLMPSGKTIEALHQSALRPTNHGYQPYQGIPELRKAIAHWYAQMYGVNLDPEGEVLPLMGSKEGITHISLTFLNPGDEVLVPELGYPAYTSVSNMVEAKIRTYPLREEDWQPDLEAMRKEDYSKVKLMWLNYPHMPTGAPAKVEILQEIIQLAQEKKFLICHDNPYSLVLNRAKPLSILSLPGAKEVCLELNSLSKSHNMAGWRVGWLCGAKDYLAEVLKIKSNVDSGMFRPVQDAAVRALQNSDAWHSERNDIYAERRNLTFQLLDALKCTYRQEQEGMFLWAKIPDKIATSEKFVDSILHKYHVFITPGFIFGAKGDRYVRVSLCNQNNILKEVINRVNNLG